MGSHLRVQCGVLTLIRGPCSCAPIAVVVRATDSEAPGASALLLLETLPWIRPHRLFFRGLLPPAGGES